MCTMASDDLPTEKPSLETLHLQAEIRKLQAEELKLRHEARWNLQQVITVSLAVLAGVSPLIVFGLTYRQQVVQYVHTLEQEQEFKVTKEFMDLVVLLTGDRVGNARAAALALAKTGENAMPFLIENLDIEHNNEVYVTIGKSLQLIVKDIEKIDERARFLRETDDQLLPNLRDNLEKLLAGKLSKPSFISLKAQIQIAKILRSLAILNKVQLRPLVEAIDKLHESLKVKSTDDNDAKEILKLLS